MADAPKLKLRSQLIHPSGTVPQGFRSLSVPVYRASTTLLRAADVFDHWDQSRYPYRYGQYGTPTVLELSARIAELEGGTHCFIAPGGQAAITLIQLAFLSSGGHLLMPQSIYSSNRHLADRLLTRLGIAVDYYDPLIGAGICALIQPNTQLIWCESPGSVTMEIQDVPAITAAARARGVTTALDNTYSAGIHFDAFKHGVDLTMQALTKYVGGHSDVLLGSVTTRQRAHFLKLGEAHQLLGMSASPDDCSLALRGLQTLAVRLSQAEHNCLTVAAWMSQQDEVATMLHPALPNCPGYDLWHRDFTGSSGLFSVILDPRVTRKAVIAFMDALHLFKIGYSWGGVTSLVMRYEVPKRLGGVPDQTLLRFNVGLEDTRDLIADLGQAFAVLRRHRPARKRPARKGRGSK
ncbi:MAG TPA: cystathionine beta-lyase [Steroidobacteraceae bacterium]|nr:cystathionine beta-lyase [Steroidobacteraceae bacterium]